MFRCVQSPSAVSTSCIIHHLDLQKVLQGISDEQIFESHISERIDAIGATNPALKGQLVRGRELCEISIPREVNPFSLTPTDIEAVAEYMLLSQKQAMEDSFSGATDELNSSGEGSYACPSPGLPLTFMMAAQNTKEYLHKALRRPITPNDLRTIECHNIKVVMNATADALLDPYERNRRERLAVKHYSNETILLRDAEQSDLFKKFLEESQLCVADVFLNCIEDRGYETRIWREFKAYQRSFKSPTEAQELDPQAEAMRIQAINELLGEEIDELNKNKKRTSDPIKRPKPHKKNSSGEISHIRSPVRQTPRESLTSPKKSNPLLSFKETKSSPVSKVTKSSPLSSKDITMGVRYDSSEKGFRHVQSPLNRSFRSPIVPQPVIGTIFSEMNGSVYILDDRVERWLNISDLNVIKAFPDQTPEHQPRYAKMNEGFLREQLLRHQCPPVMADILRSPLFREKYTIHQGDSLYLKVKVSTEEKNPAQDFGIMSVGVDQKMRRIFHSYIHTPSSLQDLREQVPSLSARTHEGNVMGVATTRVRIEEEVSKFREIFVESSRFPLIEFVHTHPLLGRVVLTFAPLKR